MKVNAYRDIRPPPLSNRARNVTALVALAEL